MFSPDRISHLSHLVLDALVDNKAVAAGERTHALKKVKNFMDGMNQKFARAFESSEKKVQSTKKNLVPGSAEYNLQLERVFLEEIRHV